MSCRLLFVLFIITFYSFQFYLFFIYFHLFFIYFYLFFIFFLTYLFLFIFIFHFYLLIHFYLFYFSFFICLFIFSYSLLFFFQRKRMMHQTSDKYSHILCKERAIRIQTHNTKTKKQKNNESAFVNSNHISANLRPLKNKNNTILFLSRLHKFTSKSARVFFFFKGRTGAEFPSPYFLFDMPKLLLLWQKICLRIRIPQKIVVYCTLFFLLNES